jgi:hypothetical protein
MINRLPTLGPKIMAGLTITMAGITIITTTAFGGC